MYIFLYILYEPLLNLTFSFLSHKHGKFRFLVFVYKMKQQKRAFFILLSSLESNMFCYTCLKLKRPLDTYFVI